MMKETRVIRVTMPDGKQHYEAEVYRKSRWKWFSGWRSLINERSGEVVKFPSEKSAWEALKWHDGTPIKREPIYRQESEQ